MEDIKKVFDYCRSTTWKDDAPDEVIWEQAKLAVDNMLCEKKYTKAKRVYRLAGQSGSGKTTQLLPTLAGLEELRSNTPLVIAVRNFVKYHPKYEEIIATCEKGEIREKTNGFALKCLCAAFKQVMTMGYLTILDVTVLDPRFEEFINKQIQDNEYVAQYHILAVSKSLSDWFIDKRKNDSGSAETGKIVKQESKDYFYDILPIGIDYLGNVDSESVAFVWSAYEMEPIYRGSLCGAVDAINVWRKQVGVVPDELELRQAKLRYMVG